MSTLHDIATKIVAAWDAGDKQHLRLLMELLRHALEQPPSDTQKAMEQALEAFDELGGEVIKGYWSLYANEDAGNFPNVLSAIESLRSALAQQGGPVAYDDKCCTGMEPRNVMQRAHALCPTDLHHTDKMAWIADYFVRNTAAPAAQPVQASKLPEFCHCEESHPMECDGCRANREAAQPVQGESNCYDMPHGWVVNWPHPNGGTKPVYHPSAVKPKFGEELDGKLTMYPVYTHATPTPSIPQPDARKVIEQMVVALEDRVAKCCAACEGIPTYQLIAEDGKPTDLAGIIDALRAEHDGFRKVAKQMVGALVRIKNLSFCADTYAQESAEFQMHDAIKAGQQWLEENK